MSCEIVIRAARPADEASRAELLRIALAGHFRDAFLYFFFQEFTLHCCVLCGAVMFIFVGASLSTCCLLLPAAALITAAAVALTHMAIAEKQLQCIRKEKCGWVAEARGALLAEPPDSVRVLSEEDVLRLNKSDGDLAVYLQVIGTVSLSEYWGPQDSGWVHALAVHPKWRRRGVARALLAASRAEAARGGLESLEAALSTLQQPARGLLVQQGWQLRGSYQRRVVGTAVTLLMAHMGIDLPYA